MDTIHIFPHLRATVCFYTGSRHYLLRRVKFPYQPFSLRSNHHLRNWIFFSFLLGGLLFAMTLLKTVLAQQYRSSFREMLLSERVAAAFSPFLPRKWFITSLRANEISRQPLGIGTQVLSILLRTLIYVLCVLEYCWQNVGRDGHILFALASG